MTGVAADRKSPVQGGAFSMWPANRFWSYQFLRAVGQSIAGGAEFSECHAVSAALAPDDPQSWHDGWRALGDRLASEAEAAWQAGHAVTARGKWHRASTYLRTAEFFLPVQDARKEQAYMAAMTAFQRALPLLDHPAWRVEVPYGEASLPGYLYLPVGTGSHQLPLVILMGGADATSEELYFFTARAFVQRGYAVLSVDGPGQGLALRRGIYSRYDYEVPVSACVDYAQRLPMVDPRRIVLAALSLGGYYAPRAAAFEHRLAGCIAWGALFDLPGLRGRLGEANPKAAEFFAMQYAWLLGATSVEHALQLMSRYTLEAVAGKIACPLLVLHGADDALVPDSEAHRLHEATPGRSELVVIPSGAPGATHCQIDCLSVAHEIMGDWLDRIVGVRG